MVAELGDHPEMVGDEEDCTVKGRLQLAQTMDDLHFQGGVQGGGGLVRDQQLRLHHQGHGDGDALAHAAGELVGEGAQPGLRIGDADAIQHRNGASSFLGRRDPVPVLDVDHLPADRKHRVVRLHGILKDHRDVTAPQHPHVGFGQAQQVASVEIDGAPGHLGIGRQQADDGRDQRRLAAAALSHQTDDPAARNVDVDLPQGVQDPATGAVVHGKIPDAQQGVVHRRSHRSSRSFGSKMSRKDSPRNVKPSVVRISGMPPATISQGVLRINA